METTPYAWSEIEQDAPVPLLTRKQIHGSNILVARVRLAKGCHVGVHQHDSEQIAVIMSGRVRWQLGAEGSRREMEMGEGEVLHIPSNQPHGVDALEDTLILDILSPPGSMGVDAQGS